VVFLFFPLLLPVMAVGFVMLVELKLVFDLQVLVEGFRFKVWVVDQIGLML